MIGKRYIDGDKLLAYFKENRQRATIDDLLGEWLQRQPKAPKLIGRQRAAEILGVGSPYMTHFIKAGLLNPIEVEGGKDAYDESEVQALKRQRERERKEKDKEAANA